MALGTGIPLSTGFDVNTNLPLDARYTAADLTERDSIPNTSRYLGMFCFVLDVAKLYWLRGGITNDDWEEFSLGAIRVVPDEAGRLAIPSEDRYEGMIVYEIATKKTWQLQGGITDDDWKAFGSGSGTGFGGKNYFVDPLFNENVDATRSYRELSFYNDGSGAFTDGGGLGYIVAFTGHGITQNQRVFYYHDGSPLDGSGNVIGIECYAQVLGEDIFGLSPVENGATEPLSDAGGINSTHYFRIYEESLDHLSASVESTSPLIEGGSLKLSFTDDGNSAVGEGIELLTNPIDREDMGKSLLFKVSADGTDDDYPEDDLIFKVVDKTNSRMLFLQGNQIKKAKKGYLIDTHLADSTKDLLVSVHVADDNASDDYDIVFGTFSIGPDSVVPGAIVSEWQSFTPTGSWTTNATYTGKWRRVGDTAEIIYGITLSGAPSGPLFLNMPSGMVIDSTKLFAADNAYNMIGYASANDAGTAAYILDPIYRTSTTIFMSYNSGVPGTASLSLVTHSAPFTFASGDTLNATVKVPIVGWDAGALFSTTELLNKSTDIVLTRATAPVANQTNNAAQITGFTELTDALDEWDTTTDTFTPRESGKYRFTITAYFAAANTGVRRLYVLDATLGSFYTIYSDLGTSAISSAGSASFEFNLIAGREYRFAYFQDSGADLNLTVNSASISRVFTPKAFSVYGDMAQVGDIKQSMLTETQFQSLHGSEWVLMDGRSVAGSRYAQITGNTTVPDARGMFLRGKNNGRSDGDQDPDGERTLGSYQADELKSHDHNMDGTSTPTSDGTQRIRVANGSSNVTLLSSPSGGTETRPRNIAVNFFIKIN